MLYFSLSITHITDFEEIARLDKEYIKNWKFSLDIQILLKTVQVVFKKEESMSRSNEYAISKDYYSDT